MKFYRRLVLSAALCTAAALSVPAAIAETYPNKHIALVVSYPPGGDTDAMARIYAEKLTTLLGQPVVVENRPGAGGTVGNSQVGRAKADGYTLLFTPNPFTTAPLVMNLPKQSSYDVLEGFEPIILTGMQSILLVTHPSTGIKTVADLVAKAKTGKQLNYASPGAGSPMHIVAEWLNNAAGIRVQHVPYRGIGPMIPDLLTGTVQMGYTTYGPVSQHISSGRLVAVALTDGERTALIPGLSTIAEQGYKDVRLGAWHGIMAPKGTSATVIALINGHMNDILKMPDVVQKMAAFGAIPVGGKAEALSKINADDYERLSKLVKELQIRAD
jgi:tripartite-type tricarboxylate transporter receptor subunit TctC